LVLNHHRLSQKRIRKEPAGGKMSIVKIRDSVLLFLRNHLHNVAMSVSLVTQTSLKQIGSSRSLFLVDAKVR
jgi:hypothetical protein